MASYRKYMFDTDFEQPRQPVQPQQPQPVEAEVVEEAEPEPPPPTFTEEELSFARNAAYEEGRQAGHAEAREQSERMTATALTALSDQIQRLFQQQETANDENARAAVRVAQVVLKKVLPAAFDAHGFEEVTRVVEEVVGHILDEPRIIVRVAEPLVEMVRERLEAACQSHGFEGRVVVQADPRLHAGDCRVEWTDGGAERDQARLLQDIDATIERALAPAERRVETSGEFAGT
jgi:flagellar assembly protein FliH